jgi:hypothetical protein
MNDDYLWDPTSPPDPDVERLEQLLGRLRSNAPAPTVRLEPDTMYVGKTPFEKTYAGVRFLGPALAAAAAIVVMVGVTWQNTGRAASWEVTRIAGTPRIGSGALAGTGRLAIGETLVTDGSSRARLQVSTIGEVTIDANTRVRLADTRDAHHQLSLERGTLHAVISAPPGQFIVDTPSAMATDLGCAYTLRVDEDGGGLISVTAGLVAFDFNGREAFVPAGASCRTDRAHGPGTPRFDDAPAAFREALDEFDFGRDPARRAVALRFVLDHPDTGDAVTLWHLISRAGEADRGAVIDVLADQVAMPPGVTREAALRLDRAALDAWWDAIGLDKASVWRARKQAGPATDSCPVTPTVHETPPRDPNADPFGNGPWHVNADRTIWVHNWSFPEWRQGLNQKVMWIRPAGAELKILGERLDGPSAPLDARIPCCYPTGFQVSSVTFPTAGCWRVTARAGDRELQFVTRVWPRP